DLLAGRFHTGLGIELGDEGATKIGDALLRKMDPTYREDFRDFRGGAAFVIRDVKPAVSKGQLVRRIDEMRFQPDFAGQVHFNFDVIGLRPVGEDAFSEFAILFAPADESILQGDGAGAWEEFAGKLEMLLTAALQREQTGEVRNFDAAIAGKTAQRAGFAVALSWLAIIAYLWLRFGNWRWGLAAVICLIHDVIIVVGLVAVSGWLHENVLGRFLAVESFKIDLPMVAAILAVIGYSVNDTIVVFDRIRENRGKLRTVSPSVINSSINQTLSRTLLTSGTTLIVVLIMYVFGGPGIHAFSYALLVGILFGTYSSVAVASPLLMGFRRALVARTVGAVTE
ncbi:MAG: protein translocase subunit SecF, partial [Phycisphaerae bacterium]|nr:protein translocase subunit SecF [Phycisphaerae bacterium]